MQADAEHALDTVGKLPNLPNTPSAKRERPITTDFDICMACSRRHKAPIVEVKRCYDEFVALDVNKDGFLNAEEFEVIVRRVCHVADGIPTPAHVFERQWEMLDTVGRGYVNFDDFFTWSRSIVLHCDDSSRRDEIDGIMSRMVKRHGFNILDLERVKAIYSRFAIGGGAGVIDKSRFKQILCRTMGMPMDADIPEDTVKRYFREIDVSGDGEVDFEEFATWYLSVHSSGS